MKGSFKWVALGCFMLVAAGFFAFGPAQGQRKDGGGAGGPKFTVVETEGTNLIIVDNSTNTLLYYTVDQGKEVGDDLHLRGTLDLNEVGKDTLKPKKAAKK